LPNLDFIFKSNNYTRLKLGQECTRVVFETEILPKKMSNVPKNLESFEPESVFLGSNLTKVISILDSSKSIPTLTQVADSFGLSTNTVKRLLGKEEATYRLAIENWRMRKAFELIQNPGCQIREISENLGYSNQANFNRAFKRWTNFSPETYRDGLTS
jgi:AraC-like DNA-binding protein